MRRLSRYGLEALLVVVVAVGTSNVTRLGPGLYATLIDTARAGATITVTSLGGPSSSTPGATAAP